MAKSIEIPDCNYPNASTLITPSSQTPSHILYLSNLDVNQPFIRFPVSTMFLYRKSTCVETLKLSLSKILVDYYPLAGRVRCNKNGKVELDCNGKGALFAEGFLDISVDVFLEGSRWPNESWMKLLYRFDHWSFFEFPPLVIQVIHLNCGGMMLLTTTNHSLFDATGLSQFLQAWAEITREPNSDLSIMPFHSRNLLKPRTPPHIKFPHPEFYYPSSVSLTESLPSQPLVPVSVTFRPTEIHYLKNKWAPTFKCTSFEILASHLWRTWVKIMDISTSVNSKLIFPFSARKKLNPNLPDGYYGNGFVLACAESVVDKLITSHPCYGVELVQKAKEKVNDDYVRSVIDLLEMRKVDVETSASLVISQLSKVGFENVDFGNGLPAHMGPLQSTNDCLMLPVIGDVRAVTMLISVPQQIAEKLEFLLKDIGMESGLKEDN